MFQKFKYFFLFLGCVVGFLLPAGVVLFLVSDILTQIFKIDPNNSLFYFSMLFGLSSIFSYLFVYKIMYKRDQLTQPETNSAILNETTLSKKGAIIGGIIGFILVVTPVVMSFMSGKSENYFLIGFPIFHIVYIFIFVFLGALIERFYKKVLLWILLIPVLIFILTILIDALG